MSQLAAWVGALPDWKLSKLAAVLRVAGMGPWRLELWLGLYLLRLAKVSDWLLGFLSGFLGVPTHGVREVAVFSEAIQSELALYAVWLD